MTQKDRPPHAPDQQPAQQHYEVGYGKPPVDYRFKPGISGNPRGRRRGVKNFNTVVRDAATRQITVRDNGKPKRMPLIEAFFWLISRDALRGDHRAARILLDALRNLPDEGPATATQLPEDDRKLLENALRRMAENQQQQPDVARSGNGPVEDASG